MTGDELRRRRTALGITQAQLAFYLGTSQQTVFKWESGATRIQHGPMMDLALRYIEIEHLILSRLGGEGKAAGDG